MNLSTIARSIWQVSGRPGLLLPNVVYDTFDQLPTPLSKAFPVQDNGKDVDIRAVVLDKDNCFALNGTNIVHPTNRVVFQRLIDYYSARNMLIVSNSSGFSASDPTGVKAAALEEATKIKVLKHTLRKPACGPEILHHFRNIVDSPSQVCVIGDRLWTDILMGNLVQSRSIWIRRGVEADRGALTRIECSLFDMLKRRGINPH